MRQEQSEATLSPTKDGRSGVLLLAYAVEAVFGGAKTLQQGLGISDHELERYYRAACRLLQKKQYDQASDAFFYLTMMDPHAHSYWLNLGLAEQLRGHYQDAVAAYGMAAISNSSDPIPHVYAAECYLEMDRLDSAVDSLQLAVTLGANESSLGSVKAQLVELTRTVQARCRMKKK